MFDRGTIIEGRYEILSPIGEGGMSHVYLARDGRLGKLWAVKAIKRFDDATRREVARASFIAEAELMRSLDHPALPRIVDIVDAGEDACVIMDYIEGIPLGEMVREQGPQPQDRVVSWGVQLCEALQYLHTRKPPVIHRDMKPSNIVLREDGSVRLVDFGIARVYDDTKPSDTVSLGTRGYAAPEQFDRRFQSDARTDIYGLGVTLYFLLTAHDPAQPPYEMRPLREWDPHLSGGLERIVARCTASDPSERYASCAEVAEDLRHHRLLDDAHRIELAGRVGRFTVVCILSACFLLVGISGFAWAAYSDGHAYDVLLAEASGSGDAVALERYRTAIALVPTRIEAYIGLVDSFGADERFTLEEERVWQEGASGTLACVSHDARYAELCYGIARLYLFYYDYGDSDAARWRFSEHWFALAADDESFVEHGTARIYADVASISSMLARRTDRGEESAEDHRAYWNAACGLFGQVTDEPTQLGRAVALQMVVRMLMDDHAHIVSAGTTPAEVRSLSRAAYLQTRALDSQSQKVLCLKGDILATESYLNTSIDADERDLERTSAASPATSPSGGLEVKRG